MSWVVAMLVLGVLSCAREEKAETASDSTTAVQATPLTLASISVPTARCEMCEETITEALKKVDGVSDAKVDAEADVAQVKYDAVKTNLASLEHAIAHAGYNANSTVRDSAAHAKLHECCQ